MAQKKKKDYLSLYEEAKEALLPLVQMNKKRGWPVKCAPHMVLPWILYELAIDISKEESLPVSKNIPLLLTPDQWCPAEEWPEWLYPKKWR
jgi:hypothetical protein